MEYPEHEKLQKVRDQSQGIGEFLDWLSGESVVLASFHHHSDECGAVNTWGVGSNCGLEEDALVRDFSTTQKLLARYFEIDLDKLEAEKRQMLDEVRKVNAR